MMNVSHIGGPTVLLEIGGLRLLTDPTFDPAGTEYPTIVYTLRKLKARRFRWSRLAGLTQCS